MAFITLPPRISRSVRSFDQEVDELVEVLRGVPIADRLFYSLSDFGDFSLIWHLIGWGRVALGNPADDAIKLSTALGIESALVNGLIKSLFRRERPQWSQDRPHRLRKPKSSSFPSGHASSAFMAARILGRTTGLPLSLHVVAALVAYSRMHVRIHHGSDVAGGVVTGALLGQLAVEILERLDHPDRRA